MPRTCFGTASFGVRDPDLAGGNLEAVAAVGHDWLLLPTTDDAAWERTTFRVRVLAARESGLEPVRAGHARLA